MQTIGQQLKKAREDKGVSLEDVYKRTKIYPHILEALEEDKAEEVLGFIYGKNFLKTYATYLGLDSAKIVQEYIGSRKEEVSLEVALKTQKTKLKLPKINLVVAVRVVTAVVVLVGVISLFRLIGKSIANNKNTNKTKIEVKVVSAKPIKSKVKPAKKVEQIINKPKQGEDLVIEIATKEDCWIRVKADGKTIFGQTLAKGKKERWQAKEKLELRIGKPEALIVFVNGEAVDLKKIKVKRSLIITREGIKGK